MARTLEMNYKINHTKFQILPVSHSVTLCCCGLALGYPRVGTTVLGKVAVFPFFIITY